MNVVFRPALHQDFDYCEWLYFAEMERINRELKFDRNVQVASFRRQWDVMLTDHQRAPRDFIGGMAGSRSAVKTTDKSSSEKKSKSDASKLGHHPKSD